MIVVNIVEIIERIRLTNTSSDGQTDKMKPIYTILPPWSHAIGDPDCCDINHIIIEKAFIVGAQPMCYNAN